jgi:hypothetical protein
MVIIWFAVFFNLLAVNLVTYWIVENGKRFLQNKANKNVEKFIFFYHPAFLGY